MSELRVDASPDVRRRPAPTIARLNTTVVKSTALTHPDALEVRADRVDRDRRFLVVRRDGTRLSGARKGPLLGIAVTERGGTLSFRFPDGRIVEARPDPPGSSFDVRLFDRTVSVRRVPHPAVDDRLSGDLGETVVLAEVLDDHAGGHHPLSIVSLATVADVGHRGGEDRLDPRRFRATIELAGCAPNEEDSWAGRRIGIGAVIARVASRIPRCLLTTLDPDSGRPDFPTLEVLADYRRSGTDLPLGVYADVERPGTIRVGDRVAVLPDRDR